jgi:hypothetical protein
MPAFFTTYKARRVLRRLGFVAARLRRSGGAHDEPDPSVRPASQADVLRPYLGKWVALAGPSEVLVAADTPQEILSWLARHDRRAPYGMFRVPQSTAEAEGAAPE